MDYTHPDMSARCSNSQQTEQESDRQKYASNCELQPPENASKRELNLTLEEKISLHQSHSLTHAPLGSSYSYVNCLHWDPVKRSMERMRCKTYEYVYTRIKLLPRHAYIRMIQVNNYSTRERVYTLNNLQDHHRIQRIYIHINTTVSV